MNVLIITEEDVFYLHEFFNRFLAHMRKDSYSIKAVALLHTFNKKSKYALARQMLGFFGPFHFVVRGFLYVFYMIIGHSVKHMVRRYGIPILAPDDINSDSFIATVKRLRIDVIVSIAAPQIFKRGLLEAAPLGCINTHSALLPENRGMMPVFWALYKGAAETGVTVHFMSETIDEGDIIEQERVSIGDESLHQLILKTKRISARLVDSVLVKMCTNTIMRRPMPAGGSYQGFPKPEAVTLFKKRGKKLF